MKAKQTATAVLFLAGLLGGAALLLSAFFGGEGHLEAAVSGLFRDPSTLGSFLAGAESAANRDLDRSHAFIQLYGGVQRITGRRVLVDMADPEYTVVRMDDGTLAFQGLRAEPVDQSVHAAHLAELRDTVTDTLGVPFLYIQLPQKVQPRDLPPGMENYGNQNADQLLDLLPELGVDTLDLRYVVEEAAKDPASPELFFCTDHHWTPEAAFLTSRALVPALSQRYGLPVLEEALDEGSYERTRYEDWFLGSQGKRVGSLYAGTDGITLWAPKFATSFTYSAYGYFEERNGPFEEALLFTERLEPKDYFGGNPYTLYSGGDYPLARMVNHANPEGPRILVIRDSFSCALAPFLALQCSELMTMDMRYFKDDMVEYLSWLSPDLVMVMYSASDTKLSHMYEFLPGQRKNPS